MARRCGGVKKLRIAKQYTHRKLRQKGNTIGCIWRKLMQRLGIKAIRFHHCRHTMATAMLCAGVHPKIVQERLGHASIATTLDLYSHVARGLQHAAANKMDEIYNKEKNVMIL